MDHRHHARTADLFGKPAGSDNVWKVNFPVSEVLDFPQEIKRRAPRVGLRGKGHRTIDRFWARVQKQADGCWIFAGAKCNPAGHIFIARCDGSRIYAHRYSYQLHRGAIPAGKVVMHTCDVPACVNPAHLQLGTQKQNIQDAIAKGRFSPWTHPKTVAARHARILVGLRPTPKGQTS